MYRAVAWKTLQQKQEVTDELIVSSLADIDINLVFENRKTRVFVNNKEVTDEIRTPEINKIVSKVAALVPVREKLTELQRKMGENGRNRGGRDRKEK